MTLTVLYDLDDTLLGNQIHSFLPAYLKLLSASLDEFPPELVIQCLLGATKKMIESPSPAVTLEENFDRHFYPALGKLRQQLQAKIDQFYTEIYPSLRRFTTLHPAAVDVVQAETRRGSIQAIATNPVFPATAILQRVNWAGFIGKSPFTLVTNFSQFHFAKPHPAFFAEVLAQLGWLEQPSVMIGNDLNEDLFPASILGMPVFWVSPDQSTLPPAFHPLSRSGGLDQVNAWLSEVRQANPEMKITSSAGILAVLKSTVAAIDTFRRIDSAIEVWHKKPAPDEWSSSEVLCHLRDVEREVNLPRIKKITAETNPFIPGISTDEWAEEKGYFNQDTEEAFFGFLHARLQTLQLLESLPPEEWQRPARHAIFGPTTLQELTGFIALHDQNHIRQIHPLLFDR